MCADRGCPFNLLQHIAMDMVFLFTEVNSNTDQMQHKYCQLKDSGVSQSALENTRVIEWFTALRCGKPGMFSNYHQYLWIYGLQVWRSKSSTPVLTSVQSAGVVPEVRQTITQVRKHTSKGSTLALKYRACIIR